MVDFSKDSFHFGVLRRELNWSIPDNIQTSDNDDSSEYMQDNNNDIPAKGIPNDPTIPDEGRKASVQIALPSSWARYDVTNPFMFTNMYGEDLLHVDEQDGRPENSNDTVIALNTATIELSHILKCILGILHNNKSVYIDRNGFQIAAHAGIGLEIVFDESYIPTLR